jgi:poly(beta-D-mannuronate) lyase
MKMRLLVFLLIMMISENILAKDYLISSAVELAALSLKAGDKVILKDVEWKNQRLIFTGNGKESNPIILTTEHPGKIKLTGSSTLLIDGKWLVVDGLYFTDGYSLKGDVITADAKSSYCRITNCAILNFNPPDKKVDYKWVSLYGKHNRVDHCWLEGKTHQGTTLVIWLSDKPNYHQVDHNYFGRRPDLGVNGGETIRIGTSTWSFYDSYTIVENNIFEHCDGELEIVSNKSCKNSIRNNLFFESKGTLTLRHGNEADVYGNYFIGNGIEKTGGIRIICENHKVHDNYFQGLTGTQLSGTINLMDGLPNPQLTSHWQVKNASIYNNFIVNCRETFVIGSGKNPERYLPPVNCIINNNSIYSYAKLIDEVDKEARVKFEGNMIDKSFSGKTIPDGFVVTDLLLKKDTNGVWLLPGSPFASSGKLTALLRMEDVGPDWNPKHQLLVNN